MIRSLRSAHRTAFTALAVLVPTIVIVGLSARTPVPRMTDVPGPGEMEPSEATGVAVAFGDVQWHLTRRDSILTLTPGSEGPAAPDVLAYWSEAPVEDEGDLTNATLLGSIRGSAPSVFVLPPADGFLSLYSLAHGVVLGTVTIPRGPDGA